VLGYGYPGCADDLQHKVIRMKYETEAARPPLTPMIDIAFLVLIFFMALPMRSLDHKLSAFLPKTEGPNEFVVRPPPKDRVVIRVRGGDKRRSLAYEIGQHRFERLSEMRPLLLRMGDEYRYEVHADAGTPWKRVVQVVDLLTGLRFKDVDFRGVKSPEAAVRRAIPLPTPR